MTIKTTAALATALLLFAASARAGTYEVQPMNDGGKFLGCMAVDAEDSVVLVGVGNALSLLVSAPEFKVGKGDPVAGTWAIDDSKPLPLSETANGPGTVSIDVPPSKANLELVTGGDDLKITVGSSAHTFSLAGSAKGISDLGACMDRGGK